MLTPNSRGNYHFLRGGAAYSNAVVADPGYGIVNVTFLNPLPVADGFDFMADYLKQQGRPAQAACAIQLRSPRPLTFEAFGAFNGEVYRPALEKHDLLVDGVSPMTRTNVAVEIDPPAQAVLYAFGYTALDPASSGARDFVLAGVGDLLDDPNTRTIVRAGETSDDAMREKAAYVVDALRKRMASLDLNPNDCTAFNIYTAWNVHPYLRAALLEPMGRAQMGGVRWYFTRPPIAGLEFEADVRRARREVYLP